MMNGVGVARGAAGSKVVRVCVAVCAARRRHARRHTATGHESKSVEARVARGEARRAEEEQSVSRRR